MGLFNTFKQAADEARANIERRSKVRASEFDWIDRHPDNGGRSYYGKDDGNGRTDWYDEDGNLDSATDTPSDSDEYLERVEHDGCYSEKVQRRSKR